MCTDSADNPDESVTSNVRLRENSISRTVKVICLFLFFLFVFIRLTEHPDPRENPLLKLTWSVSHVDSGGVFSLVSHRIGDVGEREFALVELVKSGQLIELVPGLLLEKVFVVEVRPR